VFIKALEMENKMRATINQNFIFANCSIWVTTRQRYKERLHDPKQTGRAMLDKDLTKLKLVLKEQALRQVFDASFSLKVSEKEKGRFQGSHERTFLRR
jgi:hypothetical protein